MIYMYDLVLFKRCLDFTSPHVACMTLGPKKRNIEIEVIDMLYVLDGII